MADRNISTRVENIAKTEFVQLGLTPLNIVPDFALIGHWKMNDNAGNKIVIDSSGRGHDGTSVRDTNLIAVSGKVDGALTFNGVSDFIDCGNSADFNIGPEFSVEAWVKCTNLTGTIFRIVSKGSSALGWEFSFDLNPDCLEFIVWQTSGNVHAQIANWDVAVDDGVWHHLFGVYKYGSYIKIYIDNIERGSSTSFTGTRGSGTAPLLVGKRSDGGFFKGDIDEVGFYRNALSVSEIGARWNSGNGTDSIGFLDIVAVNESLSFSFISALDLSCFESIVVLENANVVPVVINFLVNVFDGIVCWSEEEDIRILYCPANVFETVSVEESPEVFLSQLFIDLSESVSISEAVSEYLDQLFINVLDPFHVLITEHIDILDLAVEIGVVMEVIYVQDIDEASLDRLITEVFDGILAVEVFNKYLDQLYLDLVDGVGISEYTEVLDIIIELGVMEVLLVSEVSNIFLPILAMDRAEEISVLESVEKNLDNLYVVTIENITVSQTASITDIVIEIWAVIEDISVGEFTDIVPSVLYVKILGDISVYEWLSQVIEALVIGEYEEIALEERINLLDLVVELEGIDNVSALENVSCHLPQLFCYVSEPIVVSEWIYVHDEIIELEVSEEILGEDIISLAVNPLYIFKIQNVNVYDLGQVVDLTIELFAEDSASVIDYLITENNVRDVYDWASVTGALVDFIGAVEIFAIYITELFTKHYEAIDLVEYLQVMSIMRPLFYQEVFISEFLGIDLRIEALLIDEISVEDFGMVYYPIYKLIFDEVDVMEFQLSKVLFWNLYPKIFIVKPRLRIFVRCKHRQIHKYWEYDRSEWQKKYEEAEVYK